MILKEWFLQINGKILSHKFFKGNFYIKDIKILDRYNIEIKNILIYDIDKYIVAHIIPVKKDFDSCDVIISSEPYCSNSIYFKDIMVVKSECTCDIFTLVNVGCKCGAFNHE